MSHTNNKEVERVKRGIEITNYLRNTYGLDDYSTLNAEEVAELCEMIVEHFLHQELQKARERYENILTPLLETMSDPRAGSTWNELAKEIQAELDQPNN